MSSIRRQSILSSIIVYFGFALGFLNTYLFVKEGGFTKEQYGLTGTFIAIASIMCSIATLGMPSYIYKFYPYYKENLPENKNDIASWALLASFIGFGLVTIAGFFLKDVINKVFANSPNIITYYYWLFPFGFGLTIFTVLESFAWQEHKSVFTNYLREVQFRLFVTILIVLVTIGAIKSFDLFVKLYSFTYLAIALIVFIYLVKSGKLHFHFSPSRVTKKFYKKIIVLIAYVWSGGLIFNLANVFDTIVLTAVLPNGLAIAGIFTLGQYMTSLIQAPQRGIISASVAPLSKAWKDKDYGKIRRIYERSSINQLIFSVGMFTLIWMNFNDGIMTFNIQQDFLLAKNVFLLIGLTRIIDMGTGVSGQIIATSTFWRFDFMTGLILLAIALPLNYLLTRQIGLMGPAISNLVAFTIYNFIRYIFLLRKFKMQPFTLKSIYAILIAVAGYLVCYWLFKDYSGILGMVIRSSVFLMIFLFAVIKLELTPDIKPVLASVRKRFRM